MVFSSVALFLDPPNWHLQSPNDETHRAAQQAMPAVAGAAATSSMTRVAKIPAPEGPLKCPRCDSSNTKFCYFNNYSLTQPRHFCKTCRRYWTRGGSLRNVPVGGGCRRNKRKRSSARRPRSPTAAQQPPHPALDEFMAPTTSQPFSFMASLHSLMTSSQQVGLGSFGSGGNNNNSQSHYELPNYLAGGGGGEGLGASYPFQNSTTTTTNNNNMEGILETASFGKGFLGGVPHHLKMEEAAAARQLNLLSKQFVTDDTQTQTQHPHPLFWSNSINHAGLWTDLSGISSSSSTTPTPLNTTIMR